MTEVSVPVHIDSAVELANEADRELLCNMIIRIDTILIGKREEIKQQLRTLELYRKQNTKDIEYIKRLMAQRETMSVVELDKLNAHTAAFTSRVDDYLRRSAEFRAAAKRYRVIMGERKRLRMLHGV